MHPIGCLRAGSLSANRLRTYYLGADRFRANGFHDSSICEAGDRHDGLRNTDIRNIDARDPG